MSATRSAPYVNSLATPRNAEINWAAFQYYRPLRRVSDYLADHPDESLTLKKAARLAGLEKIYFSKYFHRKVGVSFKYWIDFVRIERATDRLQTSDRSVAEVGFALDFNDASTFIRTFRRIAGTTPQQYRNSHKGSLRVPSEETAEDNYRR